jgi:hypothetical protein
VWGFPYFHPGAQDRIVGTMPRTLRPMLTLLAVCALAGLPARSTADAQSPSVTCRDWASSEGYDSRFKVWACRDGDPRAAADDIATLAGMVEQMWGPMTQDPPVGMGPPKPDAYGPNFPAEVGGDARIDFYALRPREQIPRAGGSSIPGDALAAARPAPPFTTPSGAPLRSSSGFVMVARARLPRGQDRSNDWKMRQDLVHEFFHVLESAHNGVATYTGTRPHWIVEASAVWAETYYLRSDSEEPHRRFDLFQVSDVGLEDPDPDHQYAAYVWPFFMEQELGPEAIFRAWQAIEPLAPGDFEGVTDAIERAMPFASRFRDFAVRNLNLTEVLEELDTPEPLYKDLDAGFREDIPPQHMRRGEVSPDQRYVGSVSMPSLSARYHDLSISDEARLVTIDMTTLSPASAVDGDALVHLSEGWWERRPVTGGVLRFCRDDDEPFNDIDRVILVVSNHDRHATVTGEVGVTADDRCSDDTLILRGTITGTNDSTDDPEGARPAVATAYHGDVTFDVTIELAPAPRDPDTPFQLTYGTAAISGEYTGHCPFSDAVTVEWRWSDTGGDEIRQPPGPDGRAAFAGVQVYPIDPIANPEWPPNSIYLSVGAGGSGVDRECEEETGYPYLFIRRVDLLSCMELEVKNLGGAWSGSCDEEDPSVGGRRSWRVDLAQIQPEPSPH